MMHAAVFAALIAATPVSAETIQVIDGDTFQAIGETIRLYGIDAPELDQPGGIAAGNALVDALEHRHLRLEQLPGRTYGRAIGIIHYADGGTTVQAHMITVGAAWVYPKYCKRPECDSWSRLQRMAQHRQAGLWSLPAPVEPWKWRAR